MSGSTPTPDTIEFAGLSLRPVRYAETVDDDGLSLTFQAALSAAETERLRSLQQDGPTYHAVIRRGVTDDPADMRFGVVLWQPYGDGAIGHQITLVSKQSDDSGAYRGFGGGFGEPEQHHLIRFALRLSAQMDGLLTGIEAGNSIDPAFARAIRDAGEQGERTGKFVFREVDSLDDCWLG